MSINNIMTPAVQLLEKNNISFECLSYHHDPKNTDFGHEAIEKLALKPHEVFKTLLVDIGEKDLVVVVVSMNKQLCLKSVAKAFCVKKANMADKQKAQTTTGYLLGGISPLGQKKRLKTLIDSDAKSLSHIYISGGKRGLEIKLNPLDLAAILDAPFYSLSSNNHHGIVEEFNSFPSR